MVLRHPCFRNNLRLQRAAENNPALRPGEPDQLAVSAAISAHRFGG